MTYIEDDEALRRAARQWPGEALLAVDTEAAGYHRYRDTICLVQTSTRTDTFVIDALAVSSLAPLEPVLADPAVEILLHDADYDLRLLERDHGLRVTNLFDTKIAAQLCGEPAIGLAYLVEKYLGVLLDKKHQRADWARRPLPPELLDYAAEDTRHLPALRDALCARLHELGRWSWAAEEFRLLETAPRVMPSDDSDAFRRLKNTSDLVPRQMAALRELYEWRESAAEERDVAPFRVILNDALVAIARAMPKTLGALTALREVPPRISERHGEAMFRAVQRARRLAESQLPERQMRRRRPPPDPELDRRVERLKAARDVAADRLGLDRGFLMPRQQLEQIARLRPLSIDELRAAPDMRNWQAEAIGAELLSVLAAS